MFGFALFAVEAIEQGTEVFNFAAESEHAHFFVAQGAFQIFELAQYFAQFALHGKRPFGALFASGDGDVVETFAGLREEERVRIFKRQVRAPRWLRERCSHREAWAELLPAICRSRRARESYSSAERSEPWAARSARPHRERKKTWLAHLRDGPGKSRGRRRPVRNMRRPSSAASQDLTTT